MLKIRLLVCALASLLAFQITPVNAAIKERAVSIATKAAGSLSGTLYSPDSSSPAPAVLILHTAGGLSGADRIHAHNLAEAGFVALVVTYQIGWVASINETLAETVDWLRKQPESRDQPVAVIGFSLGASKALLVAALRPKVVKAVVSYYGTYNVDISKFKHVARQVRSKTGLSTPSPFHIANKIEAAVLLLQGANDDETPPDQTAQMKAALEKGKKTYEIKIYPGAVHMFEREQRFHPPGLRTGFGTITGYDPAAAKDSWQKTVDWLKQHLR